jgi:hypothetical protein
MTAGKGTTVTGTATTEAETTSASGRLFRMAGFRSLRRTGTIGVALTAWDIWRRIPKKHRRAILRQARKHGPKVAAKLMQQQQRRRRAG